MNFELTETQEQIIEQCAPNRLIYANRQTGKTTALMALTAHLAKKFPGAQIGYVTNTCKESRRVRNHIVKMSDAPIVSNRIIEFYNGSIIKFPYKSEDLRAHSFDVLFIDDLDWEFLAKLDNMTIPGTYVMGVTSFLHTPNKYEVVKVG